MEFGGGLAIFWSPVFNKTLHVVMDDAFVLPGALALECLGCGEEWHF